MSVDIEVVAAADEELTAAFARLLPQLSGSAAPLDPDALSRLISHEANTVLVARVEGVIVGTLTLVTFPLPSGTRARVEDVVVDDATRGQGVGAALTGAALRLAREAGAATVDLTSRPSRTAANRLYARLGFTPRDTTVHRFTL